MVQAQRDRHHSNLAALHIQHLRTAGDELARGRGLSTLAAAPWKRRQDRPQPERELGEIVLKRPYRRKQIVSRSRLFLRADASESAHDVLRPRDQTDAGRVAEGARGPNPPFLPNQRSFLDRSSQKRLKTIRLCDIDRLLNKHRHSYGCNLLKLWNR